MFASSLVADMLTVAKVSFDQRNDCHEGRPEGIIAQHFNQCLHIVLVEGLLEVGGICFGLLLLFPRIVRSEDAYSTFKGMLQISEWTLTYLPFDFGLSLS